VTGLYLDTSAVGRVLLGEPDSAAIVRELGRFEQHVSSRLLRVELRRLALRHGVLTAAEELLGAVALVPLSDELLAAAETIEPAALATLDALHLVTALRLAEAGFLDTVLTYDTRLADGAARHGLTVLAPA
jgi:predicted nucleic acid-binding protein